MATLRNAWFETRELLGRHRLTFPLLRLAPGRRAVVDRGSDVCIGGYIRSGNTYAFHAFKLWNPEANVAHHVHVPEQVARAVRLGVPCAVIVRAPLDAATSLVIFEDGRLDEEVALRGYLRYHRAMLELREGIVVCRFEELLDDPAVLVRRVNERFRTSFGSAPMDDDARQTLLATIERYHRNRDRTVSTFSVPSEEKERRKPAIRERLARSALLAEAEEVHLRLVAAAG